MISILRPRWPFRRLKTPVAHAADLLKEARTAYPQAPLSKKRNPMAISKLLKSIKISKSLTHTKNTK